MKLGFAAITVFAVNLASILATPIKRDLLFQVVADNSADFKRVPIYKVPDHTQVFSVGGDEGYKVTFTLKDDTTLVDQDNDAVYINPDTGEVGNTKAWHDVQPSTNFSVKDDRLYYNDDLKWKACPTGDGRYSLTSNYDCDGASEITIFIV